MPNGAQITLGDLLNTLESRYLEEYSKLWRESLHSLHSTDKLDPILSRIKKIEARHTTKEPLTPANWYLDDDEDWDEDYEEDEDDY